MRVKYAEKRKANMYKVRLDKHGVEFGALRGECATLEEVYDWIAKACGNKVESWVLEETGESGVYLPPISNVAHFVDNDMSVDIEGWLRVPEGVCDAYFFHIVKD